MGLALTAILYTIGVAAAAMVGFLCPIWYLGFVPLSVGAIWAAYDLVDVEEPHGNSPGPPAQRT